MNAFHTRLLRLYPRAWRARYEGEFLALLQDRPPTLLHVVDILLGALDAHVSREFPGEVPDEESVSERLGTMNTRITAGAAAGVGLAWLAAYVFGIVVEAQWAFFLLPLFAALSLVALIGLHVHQVGRSPAMAWLGFVPALVGSGLGLIVIAMMIGDIRPFGMSPWDGPAQVGIVGLFGGHALFALVTAAIGALPRAASALLVVGSLAMMAFHFAPGQPSLEFGIPATILYSGGWIALGSMLFTQERVGVATVS